MGRRWLGLPWWRWACGGLLVVDFLFTLAWPTTVEGWVTLVAGMVVIFGAIAAVIPAGRRWLLARWGSLALLFSRLPLRVVRLTTLRKMQEVERRTTARSVEPNLRLEVDRIHDAIPLYRQDKPETLLYSLIQVWFVNIDPVNPVRELSAEVGVKPIAVSHEWKRSHGRWAIGTKPENVGSWTELRPKVDLQPGAVAKLNAFSRWEDQTYIFADDRTMDVAQDSLHIPWDNCFVQIHLRGIAFERLFTFRLLSGPTFALLPEG